MTEPLTPAELVAVGGRLLALMHGLASACEEAEVPLSDAQYLVIGELLTPLAAELGRGARREERDAAAVAQERAAARAEVAARDQEIARLADLGNGVVEAVELLSASKHPATVAGQTLPEAVRALLAWANTVEADRVRAHRQASEHEEVLVVVRQYLHGILGDAAPEGVVLGMGLVAQQMTELRQRLNAQDAQSAAAIGALESLLHLRAIKHSEPEFYAVWKESLWRHAQTVTNDPTGAARALLAELQRGRALVREVERLRAIEAAAQRVIDAHSTEVSPFVAQLAAALRWPRRATYAPDEPFPPIPADILSPGAAAGQVAQRFNLDEAE